MKARLAVAAAIVLAGAAGGAFALWPTSPSRQAGCFDTTLSSAAKRELAADARRIEYIAERSSDGSRGLAWNDPVTGRSRHVSYDATGRITSVLGQVIRGSIERSTWLEYDSRRALVDRVTLPGASYGDTASRQSESYRNQLRLGTARAIGVEAISGQRLLHVRVVQHFPPLTPKRPPGLPKGVRFPVHVFPARTLRIDSWLDPATYLPVVTRTSQGTSGEVTRQAWLPRTHANLAKTVVRIPRDFTLLRPDHGSQHLLDTFESSHRPQPRCAHS